MGGLAKEATVGGEPTETEARPPPGDAPPTPPHSSRDTRHTHTRRQHGANTAPTRRPCRHAAVRWRATRRAAWCARRAAARAAARGACPRRAACRRARVGVPAPDTRLPPPRPADRRVTAAARRAAGRCPRGRPRGDRREMARRACAPRARRRREEATRRGPTAAPRRAGCPPPLPRAGARRQSGPCRAQVRIGMLVDTGAWDRARARARATCACDMRVP